MTSKQKELRKQRVKNILLKSLHVVCYILSLLFIFVCIVCGVKSCEKTPQSLSAEEESSSFVLPRFLSSNDIVNSYKNSYRQRLSNNFTITLSESESLANYFGIPTGTTTDAVNTNITKALFVDTEFTVYKDYTQSYSSHTQLNFVYRVMSDTYGNRHYRLRAVVASINYNNWDNILIDKLDSDGGAFSYRYYGPMQVIFDNDTDFSTLMPFNFFYIKNEVSIFTFNRQFNYNAPLGTNLSGLYGSASFDSSGQNMRYKNFNVGYFFSNGQLFNQIQYWCIQSESTHVLIGSDDIELAPSGYWIYSFMYYRNTDTNYEILVNYHDQVPFSRNGSTSTYYSNSSTWVNDSFRYITFLETLPNNLNIIINSFNNNNQSYYNGQIYTDGSDIFTLLSLGFSSLSEFWSINILPGISIGVLFFLPAVVGIIITIVHLLRK